MSIQKKKLKKLGLHDFKDKYKNPQSVSQLKELLPKMRGARELIPEWAEDKVEDMGLYIIERESNVSTNYLYNLQPREDDDLGSRARELVTSFRNGYENKPVCVGIYWDDKEIIVGEDGITDIKIEVASGYARDVKNDVYGQTHEIYQILKIKDKRIVDSLLIYFNRKRDYENPNSEKTLIKHCLKKFDSNELRAPKGDTQFEEQEMLFFEELDRVEPLRDAKYLKKIAKMACERLRDDSLIKSEQLLSWTSGKIKKDFIGKNWGRRPDKNHKYAKDGIAKPKYGFMDGDYVEKRKPYEGSSATFYFNTKYDSFQRIGQTGKYKDWLASAYRCWQETKKRSDFLIFCGNGMNGKRGLENYRTRVLKNLVKEMKLYDYSAVRKGQKGIDWTKVFKIIAFQPHWNGDKNPEDFMQAVNPNKQKYKKHFRYYFESKEN